MGELLLRARGHDAGPGTVSELHLKHLLALNLRKLRGGEHAFVPRSYVLQPGCLEEFGRFALDFKISKALALVGRVARGRFADEREGLKAAREPEGLWHRQLPSIAYETSGAGPEVSEDCLDAAMLLLGKAFAGEGIEEEWRRLCDCDTRGPIPFRDGKECQRLSEVADLQSELQMPLLRWNLWALKPSCGQFGRGILLIDRLPSNPQELLDWAAAVGRGGLKGNNDVKEGCVLQKLVEEPHLLDKELLDRGSLGTPLGPKFKYNLRMIVLASLRSPCSIWLYNEGFVSVALSPFSSQLDPLSHITNLRQGSGYDSQRRWPIRDLDSYLQSTCGSSFDDSIRPQVKRIVSSLFHALSLHPTSLQPVEAGSGRSAVGKKLRRFGFDFLIDAARNVWLLEVNFLKNGYALGHAQAGSAGDAKRDFVQDFLAQEALLRMATAVDDATGLERPESFEELLPELCFTSPEQGRALQLAACVQLFWAPFVPGASDRAMPRP